MEKSQKKSRFYLPWPWNILAAVIVAAVLGYFIGYLWSILLVVLLFHYQNKKNPGMPEEGYCMARTRTQLKWLPLGLVFAVLGGAFLWGYWYGRTHQMPMETKITVAFLIIGPLFLLFGLFLCYTSLRDSFIPERSQLAQSIRSQLPYPDEAPPVSELFSKIDQDLQENGQTIDRVMIGKEWVLGDEASYIPRIRAVFGRDEIVHRHHDGKTTSSRVIELYIVDDRNQTQRTRIKNPNKLTMIMDCLRLQVPDAHFGPYNQMSGYLHASEEERSLREREYRRKQAEKDQ